jgi:hypothetical protein
MISKTLTPVLKDNKAVVDVGLWETLTIQVINGGGTLSLLASDDAGAITGVTDGNATTADNFNAVQAVNLTTGATATAITGTNLFRISPVSFRFLQIGDGATATADEILVHCTKPY